MTDQDLKLIIKKIAVENFNRNGYHGTTIRTIASEADCSIPMVYYYFKSKLCSMRLSSMIILLF